ncbi:regulator of chromosome condensation 1/beta-lactamase-inhibitor protein II [Phakopsora pachyrhizi]|nr:regulator of chromosome condensation 1/beta-lactamase-inhibitor protein II [Phakopsora pachyrhizi]
MIKEKGNQFYAFGSNLFQHSCPADLGRVQSRGHQKVLREPTAISSLSDGHWWEVLKVTDSQTLLRRHQLKCLADEKDEVNNQCLEIWGYDESKDVMGVQSRIEEHHSLPSDVKIKKWIGRERVVGCLTEDGRIGVFHNHLDSQLPTLIESKAEICLSPIGRNYQDLTISDTGQVLAALQIENYSQQEIGLSTENVSEKSRFKLELWSSFKDFAKELLSSIEIDQEPLACHSIKFAHLVPEQSEISLASGAAHFLILTQTPSDSRKCENLADSKSNQSYQSTLYSFGDNRYGQLGLGYRSQRVESPTVIQDIDEIVEIGCGLFHSAILGTQGELYTFGYNRLDIGGKGESGNPIDVFDFSCGSEHTVVLTSSGVWVTGSNKLGQLGLNQNIKSIDKFHLNENINLLIDPKQSVTKYIAQNVSNSSEFWKVLCGRWNTFVWRGV